MCDARGRHNVELHAADAERVLLALLRAGDEPVERYRDVKPNPRHAATR